MADPEDPNEQRASKGQKKPPSGELAAGERQEASEEVPQKHGFAEKIRETVDSLLGRRKPLSPRAETKRAKRTTARAIREAAAQLGPVPEPAKKTMAASAPTAVTASHAPMVAEPAGLSPGAASATANPVAERAAGRVVEEKVRPAPEPVSAGVGAAGPLAEERERRLGAKAAAQSSKYDLEYRPVKPYEPPASPVHAARELPAQYESTRLVLLVRDPEWLFAYWEVSSKDRERLASEVAAPEKSMVLRLHDLTKPTNGDQRGPQYLDVQLPSGAGSSYIHVEETNRAWRAELGVMSPERGFVVLCRSNMIMTPRDSVADWGPEDIVEGGREREFYDVFRLSGGQVESGVGATLPVGPEDLVIQGQHGPLRVRRVGAREITSPMGPSLQDHW